MVDMDVVVAEGDVATGITRLAALGYEHRVTWVYLSERLSGVRAMDLPHCIQQERWSYRWERANRAMKWTGFARRLSPGVRQTGTASKRATV